MKTKKGGINMAGNTAAISLPRKEEKRLVQAEVNMDLWLAVDAQMKKDGIQIRQMVEFGLKSYLIAANPQAAKELGLK